MDEQYGSFLNFKSLGQGNRNRPNTPQVQELRTCTTTTPGGPKTCHTNGVVRPLMVPEDLENTPLLAETRLQTIARASNSYGSSDGDSGYDLKVSSPSRSSSTESISQWKDVFRNIKIAVITLLVIAFSVITAFIPDAEAKEEYYSINRRMGVLKFNLTGCTKPEIKVVLTGAFLDRQPQEGFDNLTLQARENDDVVSQKWNLVLQSDYYRGDLVVRRNIFDLDLLNGTFSSGIDISATSTNLLPFPFSLKYICHPEFINQQVIYAAAVLVFVYILIIFELVHRTIAAMLGALAAIAILSLMNERPDYDTLVSWIDYETLTLLMGMMVLVSIFCETGFFDWAAFQAYKKAKGNIWVLITILCFFAAIVSAFLDNVTTMLLLTPVTIRLCEVLNLDPRYVLIAEVIFSNIGGAATAVGDPPNVIIVSNTDAQRKGVDFNTFTSHLCLGVIFITLGAYVLLRVMFMNLSKLKNKEPKEIMELKHEIEIWRRASVRITVATREESMVKALLLQKVATLENLLQNRKLQIKENVQKDFEEGLVEMEAKYRVRDKVLLVKTGIILGVVILLFFLSSFIPQIQLSLGWIAILGAIWLLVLSDIRDLEVILDKVEWATLLFFAALFILMQALSEMGLMQWIGNTMASWIEAVEEQDRLAVAIILILWVSALASSFIDNIPFTTAMVPVLVQLGEDSKLNLPFLPLVWALAFGTCLGGNGTLIGASANVVCAGIAEQHGYGFSFVQFFKIGFPMMLLTVLMAMCYLLICHCTPLAWNYS